MISDERRHFIGDQPRPPQGAQSEPGPSVRRTGPPRGHSALSDRSALGGKAPPPTRKTLRRRQCTPARARSSPNPTENAPAPRARASPTLQGAGAPPGCGRRSHTAPPQALGKSGLDHLAPRGARGEQPGAGGAARPPGPRQRRRHGRPSGRRP